MPIPSCSPGATCTGGKGWFSAMPIPSCSPGATCTGGKGWQA
jgi:hypothetical protein